MSDWLRAEGVYAAGDVIGAPQLASTGIEQAESAIDAMLGRRCVSSDDARIEQLPFAVEDCSPAALLSNAARYPIGIWTMPELAFPALQLARFLSNPSH